MNTYPHRLSCLLYHTANYFSIFSLNKQKPFSEFANRILCALHTEPYPMKWWTRAKWKEHLKGATSEGSLRELNSSRSSHASMERPFAEFANRILRASAQSRIRWSGEHEQKRCQLYDPHKKQAYGGTDNANKKRNDSDVMSEILFMDYHKQITKTYANAKWGNKSYNPKNEFQKRHSWLNFRTQKKIYRGSDHNNDYNSNYRQPI